MKIDDCLEVEFTLPEDAPLVVAEVPYTSLILREVIGLDEEAVSQPSFKENPPAMLIELISRCIVEVPGAERLPSKKELKNVPVGVLDLIVKEIRSISVGDEMPFKATCPVEKCGNVDERVALLSDMVMKEGSFKPVTVPLERGIMVDGVKLKKAIIKCPDGWVQDQFMKFKDYFRFGEISTDLIYACLVSIDGVKVDKSAVSRMAKVDRKKLTDVIKNFPGLDIAIAVTCSKCGKEYEANAVLIDFLA